MKVALTPRNVINTDAAINGYDAPRTPTNGANMRRFSQVSIEKTKDESFFA